jgi:hypothetical protein
LFGYLSFEFDSYFFYWVDFDVIYNVDRLIDLFWLSKL